MTNSKSYMSFQSVIYLQQFFTVTKGVEKNLVTIFSF